MSGSAVGIVIALILLCMLIGRVQIGIAMLVSGAIGYYWMAGELPLLSSMKHLVYARFSIYDLSVIPLFLLMGQFATHGGLSVSLFRAANALVGHWRGGMAMSGIASCAGFGAICGSSIATAATMTQVVLPELKRHQYAPSLAAGSLAAGGTLGIMIPPSVPLVIYAILAEQNIAKLFVAALIPGLLAAGTYIVVIALYARLVPGSTGPGSPRASWPQRLSALAGAWPVIAIIFTVIGGIYSGIFTPTEAAAVGALATAAVAWKSGGLRRGGLMTCVKGAAVSTGMIFLILLGADVLNTFLALSQIPNTFSVWVQDLGLGPFQILLCIILIYIVLGCIMDSLSMILLTVPIFLPIILAGGYFGLSPEESAIWFGIIALAVMEIGLITPPVGMNVYIIGGMAKDIPLPTIFRGVLPFLASDLVRIMILISFPILSLGLVRWFY